MELGTFGAILGFAMDLETQAAELYQAAAKAGGDAEFGEHARAARKRVSRLERARREAISEMILEAIVGLDRDAYLVELDLQTEDGRVLMGQALALEEAAVRFYLDAAAKMPIREVVRLFDRLAREHGQQARDLEDGALS